MKKKAYLTIIIVFIGIFISYILFFYISSSKILNSVNIVNESSSFKLSAIIDIPKERIDYESEAYIHKKFVEYDCVVDSSYCITVIKVGKFRRTDNWRNINISKSNFPSRDGWFSNYLGSPGPFFDIPIVYIPCYNFSLLPLNEIQSVSIYLDGNIIKKEYINDHTFNFVVNATRLSVSFNNINKEDLFFSYAKKEKPPLSNIFFSITPNNDFYIGYVSTFNGTAKTLKEIINDNKSLSR